MLFLTAQDQEDYFILFRLSEELSQINLVPRAFPLKIGWGGWWLKIGWCPTHFLREKPWGRGWSQIIESVQLNKTAYTDFKSLSDPSTSNQGHPTRI